MNKQQLKIRSLGVLLLTCGCLMLALDLSSHIGLRQIPLVTAKGAENFGLAQDTRVYLPLIFGTVPGYYVDSLNGSDANPGTSEAAPWKTLAPVHAKKFTPGSVIHFKRGSSWTGGLIIDDSGTPSAPILFTTYGTGNAPVIRNPGSSSNWTNGVAIRASWVVVEGLLVRDAYAVGVNIYPESDHNIIRDVEITNVGDGIHISGQNNLVTRNHVHDLHMIVNTPGGTDDFGAVGVTLFNSYNEVSYNTFVNCIAPSYDFGQDGGVIEIWGTMEGISIHHNWTSGNKGFIEIGEQTLKNSTIAYNVSYHNTRFSSIHLGTVENLRVENNTIVETRIDSTEIFGFNGSPTANTFILRNNLVYADKFVGISNASGFTHDHNLYCLTGGTQLGFTLGQAEKIVDPLLVNYAGQDFHLMPGSPAIDAGVDLGYSLDFENYPVPVGAAPDLGAFEYGGTPGPTPTPNPNPTPNPTPTPNPNEIIIDNTDPGFSTSFVQDAWQEFVQVGGQHYGDSHYYNRQIGTGLDIATWSFTVSMPGRYQVYAWWADGSWRPTDVPYTISALRGTVIISSTTVRVNQQTNGGQWNLLGTFDFQDQGSIMVSDDASSGQDIVADAVRLVYLAPLASANLASTLKLWPSGAPTPTLVSPVATPMPIHAP